MSPELKLNRYLTKSRFKLALECVSKLYYTGKKDEYADQNLNDPFLLALAEGGFQVGELAKFKFCEDPVSEGITIEALDYEKSLEETNKRLHRDGKVVIAEAAFKYENLFIRADIIVKENGKIQLYEVKSKSFDGQSEDLNFEESEQSIFLSFEGKDKECVNSTWIPYLYDLAFQKYVITKAMPGYEVNAHLILVNKNAVADVEGLNQKFVVLKEGKNKKVVIEEGLKATDLGSSLLYTVPLDEIIDKIWKRYPVPTDYQSGISFEEFVKVCSDTYAHDHRVFTGLGKKCRDCQFYKTPDSPEHQKSGFIECWKKMTPLTDDEINQPLVLEIWNGGAGQRSFSQELIEKGIYLLKNVSEEHLQPESTTAKAIPKSNPLPGLSKLERRIEQINRVKNKSIESYFDKKGIHAEMDQWEGPLHMIDFETSMVALPFHKGAKPYQGIAFQFSHHILREDGTVEHYNQFLHSVKGVYPNIEFIRALKKSLTSKSGVIEGKIFRYHNHENTYLNMIYRQLEGGAGNLEKVEREGLMEFIRLITRWRPEKKKPYIYGPHVMVDLFDLVLRYYYPPYAKGSNSLKQILPSIIRDSEYLRDRYGKPGVYGRGKQIKSLNFDEHVWIKEEKNLDPYKTLNPIFENYDREKLDLLVRDFDGIADGGAALTAYNYLQFSRVPADQIKKIEEALFKYCELDTLAMVMIVEAWREWK